MHAVIGQFRGPYSTVQPAKFEKYSQCIFASLLKPNFLANKDNHLK